MTGSRTVREGLTASCHLKLALQTHSSEQSRGDAAPGFLSSQTQEHTASQAQQEQTVANSCPAGHELS